MDGEPPDLPPEGYSEAARNFVRGCLNKIPNLRPTYAMLLQHAWLAPLYKPETILEEDEEEDASPPSPSPGSESEKLPDSTNGVDEDLLKDAVDREVAIWVIETLDKKKRGVLGKGRNPQKPALHAAPLDAVSSPEEELTSARAMVPS